MIVELMKEGDVGGSLQRRWRRRRRRRRCRRPGEESQQTGGGGPASVHQTGTDRWNDQDVYRQLPLEAVGILAVQCILSRR